MYVGSLLIDKELTQKREYEIELSKLSHPVDNG
jgi:hypothetical protein